MIYSEEREERKAVAGRENSGDARAGHGPDAVHPHRLPAHRQGKISYL